MYILIFNNEPLPPTDTHFCQFGLTFHSQAHCVRAWAYLHIHGYWEQIHDIIDPFPPFLLMTNSYVLQVWHLGSELRPGHMTLG
jgi:hypothetical protein